ncbi:MAG TPA: hypothetical protein VFK68_05110 [Propionibacteriaceae bacterium]|nr:hypothetical protein [Propionibacteriaceae bacterium]
MTGPHLQPTPPDPEIEPRPTTGTATAPDGTFTVVNPRRLLFRLAAVVVLVVVAVAGYVLVFARSDATAAKVGDCVSVTGTAADARARRVACSDAGALYVVTAAGPKVNCDASEVTYTGGARDRTRLCLFYNLRVGDCLSAGRGGEPDTKAACAPGMLKVVYVDTSSADETKCPPAADVARTDDTSSRLICFATVT